jgi:Mg2+-importing ATPase
MAASSNFGNVFSVLGASFFLPFLPLLPVQMLIQNLLYDLSQTAIPFDHVDEEYLEKPRRWEIADIGRFMLFLGPVSSIFDYATFALMWYVFGATTPASQGLFQAGWFIEGLLSQTLIVHVIRTRRIPLLQSRPSVALLVTTAVVMALGVWFPFSALGRELGFIPPPQAFFPWLAALLAGYCVIAHGAKVWFYRRYGYR